MLRIYYAGCVHNGKCIKSVSSPSVRVVSQRWCGYWGVAVSESPRPAPARPANVSALLSDKRFTLTLVLYVCVSRIIDILYSPVGYQREPVAVKKNKSQLT